LSGIGQAPARPPARQGIGERALVRIERCRVIGPAVEQRGQRLRRPAVDQEQGREHRAARPGESIAGARAGVLQPPVEARPGAQHPIRQVAERAPVLGPDVAPLPEIARHDALGRRHLGVDTTQELDRGLDARGGGHEIMIATLGENCAADGARTALHIPRYISGR